MNGQQEEIDTIFLEAIEIAPEKRASFLEERCAHLDPSVRDEIEKLLKADEAEAKMQPLGANPHLNVADFLPVTDHREVEGVGQNIGHYQLLQKLGEGGMGVVYMADQKHPVKRRVALKVIKPGMGSKQVVARFEAERQALAMMDHPNIAKVLDAGSTDAGLPYFVMELVRGVSIIKYCDDHQLDVPARLKLFVAVCHAVQHAHQKGIIHRDLKPSNILVADYDDLAVPKVIDFGLAKALQQPLTEATLFTRFGQIVGTFEYMSPEQARLNQLDIDTRTDVYSLGALLYELLTGAPPFATTTLRQAAFDEILRIIREVDPPQPSTKISSLNESDSPQRLQAETRKRRSIVRGDLDAITMKALEKDRVRRYTTSAALADDVERYLLGERVSATPLSPLGVVARTLRKNRKFARLCLIAFAIAIVFALGSDQVRRAAERAQLVHNFFRVETDSVTSVIKDLRASGALRDSYIIEQFQDGDEKAKLRAALAMSEVDSSVLPYLVSRLWDAIPEDFLLITKALSQHSIEEYDLWNIAEDDTRDADQRFRATCALAQLDSSHTHWRTTDMSTPVVEYLVRSPKYQHWIPILHPIRQSLIGTLQQKLSDPANTDNIVAVDALDAMLDDDSPDRLKLILDAANPRMFQVLWPVSKENEGNLLEAARDQILQPVPGTDAAGHAIACRRRANAAIALTKLGEFKEAAPVLVSTNDQTARSLAIRGLAEVLNVKTLLGLYQSEYEVSVRRALLLALGSTAEDTWQEVQSPAVLQVLIEEFKNSPEPGLHGVLEWLLRRWAPDLLPKAEENLKGSDPRLSGDRGWLVNSLGQTFTLLSAGAEEPQNARSKKRRYLAIGTKEVTSSQFLKFDSQIDPRYDMSYFPEVNSPMGYVSWYRAAAFCNWLSKQDGIPEAQWCFEPNSDGEFGPGMRAKMNYFELTGYRLPLGSEWERACSAGTTTGRHYGEGFDLLNDYGWYSRNSAYPFRYSELTTTRAVGTLKPNDYGLFDMYGNVYEWCLNAYIPGEGEIPGPPDLSNVQSEPRRSQRGGSFYHDHTAAKSTFAGRSLLDNVGAQHGLRVVRYIELARP